MPVVPCPRPRSRIFKAPDGSYVPFPAGDPKDNHGPVLGLVNGIVTACENSFVSGSLPWFQCSFTLSPVTEFLFVAGLFYCIPTTVPFSFLLWVNISWFPVWGCDEQRYSEQPCVFSFLLGNVLTWNSLDVGEADI
jgi:hypothetical protein